jgi:HK97 gp10 family phage protein
MIKVRSSNWFARVGDEVKVDFTGLEHLQKELRKLENHEQIENKALNKAGEYLVDKLKENAPYHDGTLQDNLKYKKSKDGEVIVHTGKAYHAHLYEFGRTGGQTTIVDKNGKRRVIKWGDMNENPFMTRTYESNLPILERIISEELKKGMGI